MGVQEALHLTNFDRRIYFSANASAFAEAGHRTHLWNLHAKLSREGKERRRGEAAGKKERVEREGESRERVERALDLFGNNCFMRCPLLDSSSSLTSVTSSMEVQSHQAAAIAIIALPAHTRRPAHCCPELFQQRRRGFRNRAAFSPAHIVNDGQMKDNDGSRR